MISPAPLPTTTDLLLEVRDLSVTFGRDGRAVRGISFALARGEVLGLVGESGSGKSVTCLAMLGLLSDESTCRVEGSVVFAGLELLGLNQSELRRIRGAQVGFIFQDPMSSLNPLLTVGIQVAEVLEAHKSLGRQAALARAAELLNIVGIPAADARIRDFPHQFSGGMRQRVMIAMALACRPSLLIADEPTTALDVTVQAQILELIGQLKEEYGMAVLLITHDLGVVAEHTDRVAVIYAGRIVETAPTNFLLAAPLHPYTAGLLRSTPRIGDDLKTPLVPIPGAPPLPSDLPSGCAFAPRCPRRLPICGVLDPELTVAPSGASESGVNGPHVRRVACHNPVPYGERPRAA